MDFFDAQDRARRSTRWLVAAYLVATLLIIAGVTAVVGAAFYMVGDVGTPPQPSVLLATAVLAALLIGGATLYKTAVLSAGGSRVATDMGGTLVPADVQDPLRRRLRNVVEEMAIASGIPAPEVYVLESEQGINAFAAGLSTGDAAIAVTRGALELLNRDELQGVVAHEFSHVLNGDMRINVRMIGVLFGIMVLAIIGRMILRGSYHGRVLSSRRNRNAPFVLAVGLGLTVLGWLGVLFARLIKAGVSRQRETLADASAVQFTRQTEGLANALKKIGGFSGHSWLRAADPEEVSHMLFASGSRRMTRLFATHPPLTERIRALEPSFRGDQYPKVELAASAVDEAAEAAGVAALAAGAPSASPVSGAGVADLAGKPQAGHIALAQRLRRAIPIGLYEAAHSLEESLLLTVALVLHPEAEQRQRQLALVGEQLGSERTETVRRYDQALRELGSDWYLPILDITFPALRRRPAPQLEFLLGLLERLAGLDDRVDLREYCFIRIVAANLRLHGTYGRTRRSTRVTRREARDAAVLLLRLAAQQGDVGVAAFRAGLLALGLAADAEAYQNHTRPGVAQLDLSLDVLRRLRPRDRRRMVEALSVTLLADEQLAAREAGLLRAVCAALDCPLPPLEHL